MYILALSSKTCENQNSNYHDTVKIVLLMLRHRLRTFKSVKKFKQMYYYHTYAYVSYNHAVSVCVQEVFALRIPSQHNRYTPLCVGQTSKYIFWKKMQDWWLLFQWLLINYSTFQPHHVCQCSTSYDIIQLCHKSCLHRIRIS